MIAPSTAGVAGLSISRLASTGAFAIGAIFAVCWAAAAAGIVGSHAFIGLFTLALYGVARCARDRRDLRVGLRCRRRRADRGRLQPLR